MKTHIALLLVGLQLAIVTPAFAVKGRAYVENERRIVKLTKEMVREDKETQAFRDLIKELDSIDLEESTRDFWRTAHAVKDAMAEEIRQGRERLVKEGYYDAQQAGTEGLDASQGVSAPPTDNPLARRVDRMEMIVLETDGLRNPAGMNDQAVLVRYRVLVGEFHSLLQVEVDEMQAEIDALKARQDAIDNQ
jgi:hypothetical protein